MLDYRPDTFPVLIRLDGGNIGGYHIYTNSCDYRPSHLHLRHDDLKKVYPRWNSILFDILSSLTCSLNFFVIESGCNWIQNMLCLTMLVQTISIWWKVSMCFYTVKYGCIMCHVQVRVVTLCRMLCFVITYCEHLSHPIRPGKTEARMMLVYNWLQNSSLLIYLS